MMSGENRPVDLEKIKEEANKENKEREKQSWDDMILKFFPDELDQANVHTIVNKAIKELREEPIQEVLREEFEKAKEGEREKVFKELLKFREREYPDEDTDEDWITIKDIKKAFGVEG